jgi:hypothetical protein
MKRKRTMNNKLSPKKKSRLKIVNPMIAEATGEAARMSP